MNMPNFTDIYNSFRTNESDHKINMMAAKKVKKSQNPKKTGVIPPNYNDIMSDSEFSDDADSRDDNKEHFDIVNPDKIMERTGKLNNNRYYEEKIKTSSDDNNNFLSQFEQLSYNNPNKPVGMNDVHDQIGNRATANRIETERNLALTGGFSNFAEKSDMNLGVVSQQELSKFGSKLKPFFKTKGSYGIDKSFEDNMFAQNQRKLELFSGSADNLDYRPNAERKPLFEPVSGNTYMYGTPVYTDLYETRYEPGKEKRNEMPFQQTRVTPGLGLTANAVSKNGYNEPFRVLPKTVDELRAANKPKISYTTSPIEGMKGTKGPVPSKVYKRRPMTFKEYDTKDMIRGVGDYRAQSVTGEIDPKNLATVNRGTKMTTHVGPAKFYKQLSTPNSLKEQVKAPHRENFKHADPRNATKQEGRDARGHNESFNPKMTQRMQKNEHMNPIGTSVQQMSGFSYTDIPNITQREVNSKNERAGMMGSNEFRKHNVYDRNDIPDINQKEMFINTERSGQINSSQFNKQKTVDMSDMPNMTQREIFANTERAGTFNSDQFRKNIAVDRSDMPNITQREMFANTERAGTFNSDHFRKNIAIDRSDMPNMTQREMFANSERAGSFDSNQFRKNIAIDRSDMPNMTQREIFANAERVGTFSSNQFQKNIAIDRSDMPNMTQRELFSKTDRAGSNGNSEFNKTKTVDRSDIPDMTQRELYSKYDRTGTMGTSDFKKYKAVDWTDVPDMNQREIYSKTERTGFVGDTSNNKGVATDWSDVPDMTQRDIYSKTDRAGISGNNEYHKGTTIDRSDVPEMTQRDIYSKTDRAGTMRSDEVTRSRGDVNNMMQNVSNEKIAIGRAPTNSNVAIGPTFDGSSMHLRDPLKNNVRAIPNKMTNVRVMGDNTRLQHCRSMLDENHAFIPMQDILNNNVYINNLVHKAKF